MNDKWSDELKEKSTGAGIVELIVGPLKKALDVQLNWVGGDGVKKEVRLLDLFYNAFLLAIRSVLMVTLQKVFCCFDGNHYFCIRYGW